MLKKTFVSVTDWVEFRLIYQAFRLVTDNLNSQRFSFFLFCGLKN